MKKYSDKDKLDVLKLWILTGNLMGSAATLKIPYETAKTWRYQKWWAEAAEEIKREGRMELSAKLRKAASIAVDQTLDRLENGDVRILPTGEISRIPLQVKDTIAIVDKFSTRAMELEDSPASNEAGVQDRLKSLADAFENLSRKVRKIDVIDVEYRDAVSKEWEEGLREGEAVGTYPEPAAIEGPRREGAGETGGGEEGGEPALEYAGGSQESPDLRGI